MAARNDSTQAENDNLREMLRRLQAENTLLKQAAFTFSVPSGASINANER
jgi:AP-1-like factor